MATERIRAQVTPSTVKWARIEAGYKTYEQAALRLRVKADKLRAWENGEALPTMKQAQDFAHLYRRPLALFFLANPPPSAPLSAEYRRLRDVQPGEESPSLRIALRSLIQRRKDTLHLLGELDELPIPFTLTAKLNEPSDSVASRFRHALGITDEIQRGWKEKYAAWTGWRQLLEKVGALVFQFSDVPMREVRGVALYYESLPIIGVNSKEDVSARPFTALHELIHLALRKAGEESSAIGELKVSRAWEEVERFVERVAGEILVPRARLLDEVKTMANQDPNTFDIDEITSLSRRFNASPRALATRLQQLDLMNWGAYQAWIGKWDAVIQAKKDRQKEKKGGGPEPHVISISNNGRFYSWLVFDALDSKRIDSTEAIRLMGLNHEQMQRARERLFAPNTQQTMENAEF